MIKKIALITCAMLLGLAGLVFLCFLWSIALVAYVTPINILIIFPLSVYYLYACFNGRRKRIFVGLVIVLAQIFPVILVDSGIFSDAGPAWNIFGTGNYLVIAEKMMPWHHLKDPSTLIFMFGLLPTGFALIESGGWCFRKAHVGSPSPKARVAVKGATLFLVNAMNLTVLAAWVGLVSKGDTTWGYLVYILAILAIGTFLLALFIWFKPTWRWWIAMLPSIVILYVMPFWIPVNDRGEIESPWKKADDKGTIEAPHTVRSQSK
ncbi:MAG: hypothetical protein V4528_15200 [Pseudomonadota bacterium]